MHRRLLGRNGTRLALAVGIIAAVSAIYGFLVEPRMLTVTTVEIRDGALAQALQGRKALLLSDLHFDSGGGERMTRRILDKIREIDPDLVFLTGDYVRWKGGREAYERALTFLAQLRAPLGVYAVLGNVDTTDSRRSCEFCHEAGGTARTGRHRVKFLDNSRVTIESPGGRVAIAGLVNHAGEGPSTHGRIIARLTGGDLPVILLAHSSTPFAEVDPSRDMLILSGDTHGGQVWAPGWVWRISGVKPDPRHMYGFFREGRKSLFVTRGLGTSSPHLRLGEPPEVVVFRFLGGGRPVPGNG